MRIYVFGLGSLGSNLLLQLAKKYPDFEYVGIDYDKVEERNIGIQAYFLEHVGMNKTSAMSVVLQRFIRKMKYKFVNDKILNSAMVKDIVEPRDYLVLDCFDNVESREFIKEANLKNCLHIGFSPELAAEITWDEKYKVPGKIDPEADDICEVRDAIPFIHFITNFAAMVVSDSLDKQVKENYIITNRYYIRRL